MGTVRVGIFFDGSQRTICCRPFWSCVLICSLIIFTAASPCFASSKPFKFLKFTFTEPEGAEDPAHQVSSAEAASAAPPSVPLYAQKKSDSSDSPNYTSGDVDDEVFQGAWSSENGPTESQQILGMVNMLLELGRRANPKLDTSQKPSRKFEDKSRVRSGSWKDHALSIVTDDDLAHNVSVEKVLKPSTLFTVYLPRKLSTSPRNLIFAAHPVVMGECDTTRRVPYAELFTGASPFHKFWTPNADSGNASRLVFKAPPEAIVLNAGNNPQFCFKVYDPETNGAVSFWVQVRATDVLPACAEGDCQGQHGGATSENNLLSSNTAEI